jgi:hypothetical protein
MVHRNICKFLTSFKISIHIKSTWPLTHRENDRYIMDIAQEQDTPIKALQLINQCRIYLRVLTISDITNPIGAHVETQFYSWREAMQMNNKWVETTKPKPNKSAWTYWRQLMGTITYSNS